MDDTGQMACDTHGEVGAELEWLFVGETCGCAAALLDWLRSFSLNDLSFFLLVCLPARYEKLSLYDLFVLLDVNISMVVSLMKSLMQRCWSVRWNRERGRQQSAARGGAEKAR